MKKRLFALVLAVCCLLWAGSAGWAAELTDTGGHWAEGQISEWVDNNLVTGYPDGTFKPDDFITRAEFVTLVNKVFKQEQNGATCNFSDVQAADWFYSQVASGTAAGYISGNPDGTFTPNNELSRAEAAVIITKLLDLAEGNPDSCANFADSGSIPDWSRRSVNAAVYHKIMRGYPDNTIRVNNFLTRAEALTLLAAARNFDTATGVVTQVPASSVSSGHSSSHHSSGTPPPASILKPIGGTAFDSQDVPLANRTITLSSGSGDVRTAQTDDEGYFYTHLIADRTYICQGEGLSVQITVYANNESQVANTIGRVTLGKTLSLGANQTVFLPSTLILSPNLNPSITEDSTLTFAGRADILTGDVFVFPAMPGLPAGLAGRVTQAVYSGGNTSINYTSPSFDEVFSSVYGTTHSQVAPAYFTPAPGVEVINTQTPRSTDSVSASAAEAVTRLQIRLGDPDSGIQAYGTVDLSSSVDGYIQWRRGLNPVNALDFNFYSKQVLDLKVAGTLTGSKEFSLGSYNFPTEIPGVLINVPVKLYVKPDGQVSIKVGAQAIEQIGIKYDRANGVQVYPEDKFQAEITPPTIEVAGKLSTGVKLQENLIIVGINLVGIEESAGFFGQVETIPDSDLSQFEAGMEFTLNATCNVADYVSPEFTREFTLYSIPWGQEPELKGTLIGKISDAITGSPIAGAAIAVYQDSALINTLSSGADGTYSTTLVPGTYSVVVSNSGYLSEASLITIPSADTITYDAQLQLVGEAYSGAGVVKGTITNALTGLPVPGLTLEFRRGRNIIVGDALKSVTTNELGQYEAELPGGNYTIAALGTGYINTSFNVISIGGQTRDNQNGTISPEEGLLGDSLRIVLNWGAEPSDLDSHFTGPTAAGDSRFHVYYLNQNYQDTENQASLDVDDTSSYGPETITVVDRLSNGTYTYAVHNYSSRFGPDLNLANSTATVRIYDGDTLINVFNVPLDVEGNVWKVFEIRDGEIVPINQITTIYNWDDVNNFAPAGQTGNQTEQTVTPGRDKAA